MCPCFSIQPGCVNTTEADIKKSSRMKQPHKTRKSVYGLQNDIRSHSPAHAPAPEVKEPTEEEMRHQVMSSIQGQITKEGSSRADVNKYPSNYNDMSVFSGRMGHLKITEWSLS
ncbi:unnamed protein product [Oncorhynchus mykiss]|uniref:Uncharacterized protein n=1 Tax=Oncorhynchus mykiss TaxID=8022 RepID=A0A060Z3Z1_ONCMY|nr:unnamed protein product [Oncorhynchus mykiss]